MEKNSIINQLKSIFMENKEKRICVVATTCTGKTTLINELNLGIDMDKEIFPMLTNEETDLVCSTPWTEEIGRKMDELVRAKLTIKPGIPMFGTVLLDCDLLVYLHINDALLKKRTKLRNASFENAKNMQRKIEKEIKESKKEVVIIEMENEEI